MPLPLIPILIVGGLVSAAAKGAAMLAESNVKDANADLQAAEGRAYEKNRQYANRRLEYRKELEALLGSTAADYEAFIAKYSLLVDELAGWTPEPWLKERMGELVVSRPLMIQPSFDQPVSANAMHGSRLITSGTNLSRTNPSLGQNMQGLGAITVAGSYVTQQVDTVVEARKYTASVRAYLFALNQTIEGFDARFASELHDDQWAVYRLRMVLYELDTATEFAESPNGIQSRAIVRRSLIEFLTGLIGKYA